MTAIFETRDVLVSATIFVRELLAEGRGGCIFGAPGSGTSHAVRAAMQGVPGGIRIDVTSGPLLGLRFMADVARQVGTDGRPVLEAVRHDGIKGAIAVAERVINGHPLIVDEAQRLLPTPESPEDPAASLWQDEKSAVLDWLRERIERTPTLLVGQRRIPDVTKSHRHRAPEEWPLLLRGTGHDWDQLGRLARGNPAVLTLARALVPWLWVPDFNGLIEQAAADEAGERELLLRLGEAFQSSAPPSWQRVIALVAAVGETPHEALVAALDAQQRSALAELTRIGLVEERPGGLDLLPALLDAGAVQPLTAQERAVLLPAVAHQLLAPIHDVRSLQPEHAARVLSAHGIFVELGDMPNAERTASLHVHGLVELARRTSLDKDYPRAWQRYDSVFRMLQAGAFGAGGDTGRHLVSYVRHYRAWNGQMAGALDEAVCLDEYRESLRQWPENALWHQRTIQAMIRLGRVVEARAALLDAYRDVPYHPRRDELLRMRPARTAMSAGAPTLSLELLDPVLEVPAEVNPGLAAERDELLGRWAQGILLAELSYRPTGIERVGLDALQGRVVFMHETKVSVRKTHATWVARLPELAADARAQGPLAALELLGAELASEARRLVSTPSSSLSDRDLRRKGSILALVDVLNSDIGIDHDEDRWLVGRIEGGRFLPTMRDLPPAEIPPALLPECTEGLYFARVPVYRDGAPRGPVEALKPAGRGRTLDDLLDLLTRMSEDEA